MAIKTYLVKGIGELLILQNIEMTPFWSYLVLEKGVIFILKTVNYEEGSHSSETFWEYTILCNEGGFFFFHYFLAILMTNRAQFYTGLLFLGTPSEDTGL